MTRAPYLDDGDARLYVGDVRDVLAELEPASVQTCVTSPPYWGLRDYGVDGQIGLEESPDAFVEQMVGVFRGVRRVLRPDGTLWLNLGDSYAAGRAAGDGRMAGFNDRYFGRETNDDKQRDTADGKPARGAVEGLKPKDLVGIPWRVAFALQADGWYLRSAIVWAKPNPMPESVTDRPTSAYEMVFLLSKSARYFYDADAIREASDYPELAGKKQKVDYRPDGTVGENWKNTGSIATRTADRNARNVWTIATQPYPEAHFATFPEELPRRCIAAGSSEAGACSACGAPHERIVDVVTLRERATMTGTDTTAAAKAALGIHGAGASSRPLSTSNSHDGGASPLRTTKGWRASCVCNADTRPCIVLDPFAGSGTTLHVARKLGRHSVGVELNPAYAALVGERLRQRSLLV